MKDARSCSFGDGSKRSDLGTDHSPHGTPPGDTKVLIGSTASKALPGIGPVQIKKKPSKGSKARDHLVVQGGYCGKDACEDNLALQLYWVNKELEKVETRLVGILGEERRVTEVLRRALIRKGQVTP